MQSVPLSDPLFQGQVSLERREGWVKPWRIPETKRSLFPPNALNTKAENATGVRLRFASNTRNVQIAFLPADDSGSLDLVIDNHLVDTAETSGRANSVIFSDLPEGEKTVEIYLPHAKPIRLTGMTIDDGASFWVPTDERPRWITYGSSITECAAAASPSQTWPAIVARQNDLHLTCLGFGGNCHLEPMVGRLIRDLPADLITLCVGINVYGAASLGPRTFQAAVIGLVELIREKHPTTPIGLFSPIVSPPREETPNAVGFTLQAMRAEVRDAAALLEEDGDAHLHYFDGLRIFGEKDAKGYLPDDLHPDAEGYRIMADNVDRVVMKSLRKRYREALGA